jgi:hypothetical protein
VGLCGDLVVHSIWWVFSVNSGMASVGEHYMGRTAAHTASPKSLTLWDRLAKIGTERCLIGNSV